MSDARAAATGTLKSRPLPHLLVYLLDHELTGTLVLEEPQGAKHAVFFDGGTPAKAKAAQSVIYLGQLLLEMGAIDQAAHDRTLELMSEERRLHGEILLAEQALDRDTLTLALREQLLRNVEWMFGLASHTAYGFYDQQNFLERWGGREPIRISALELMRRGLRVKTDPEVARATLTRLGERVLRLHPSARPGLFKFDDGERAVTDVLRAKPQPLASLLNCGVGPDEQVQRVVYLLAITRHLDLGVEGQQPLGVDTSSNAARRTGTFGSAASAPSAPQVSAPAPAREPAGPAAAPLSAAARRRLEEMRQRADEMPGQNYYQILGVEPDADRATIQAAFFQLAKAWHPDRLTGDLAEVRDVATRAFSRMTEAHQILCDDDRRSEYDALLKQGGGSAEEQEQVARVLHAVGHFQKAEVLLKKGNLQEAEVEARAAAEGDPEQPEYQALLAWVTGQLPERIKSGKYGDLIATLDEVIKKNPDNERARIYRGQLLKRAGKNARAMKDFLWITENNPKNLDAAREVRLFRMRKGDERSEGGKQKGTLLSKLFKR
jgi:curved DNA-binding protein CbpA